MACQASQRMSSVMGYVIQGQGQTAIANVTGISVIFMPFSIFKEKQNPLPTPTMHTSKRVKISLMGKV
jgi:hypothetical protein